MLILDILGLLYLDANDWRSLGLYLGLYLVYSGYLSWLCFFIINLILSVQISGVKFGEPIWFIKLKSNNH